LPPVARDSHTAGKDCGNGALRGGISQIQNCRPHQTNCAIPVHSPDDKLHSDEPQQWRQKPGMALIAGFVTREL
jgi:hypothetical protein